MGLVIGLIHNMKKDIFHNARFKLTAYYVGIMLVILIVFSSIFIYTIDSKLVETLDGKIKIENIENTIEDTSEALELLIYYIDGVFLLIIAVLSYFLAGSTLRPIKDNLEAQKKFSADASHDLRTPLAIITTESEVALQDNTSSKEDLRKVIKSNIEEANKMSKLVNDLLHIARGENENTIINLVVIDLHNILDKIVSKLKFKADEKNLKLWIGDYKKILVEVNVIDFERAISNILQNAVYYTKIGEVKIIIEDDVDKVRILISDTGIGIREKDLPYVFARFFKAKNARNYESGSGLGLPIAKQIIEHHNGRMSIESEENFGTTVTVILPKSNI